MNCASTVRASADALASTRHSDRTPISIHEISAKLVTVPWDIFYRTWKVSWSQAQRLAITVFQRTVASVWPCQHGAQGTFLFLPLGWSSLSLGNAPAFATSLNSLQEDSGEGEVSMLF